MNADLLVINCSKHGRTGPLATSVRCGKCAEEDRQELLQLRGILSLAEEGPANYEEENQRLRTALNEVLEELRLGDTRHDLQAKIILALGSPPPQTPAQSEKK